MQKKCGKFFADWRDQHGKRHRKAFNRKRDAQAFAKGMRTKSARLKKAHRSAASATS